MLEGVFSSEQLIDEWQRARTRREVFGVVVDVAIALHDPQKPFTQVGPDAVGQLDIFLSDRPLEA